MPRATTVVRGLFPMRPIMCLCNPEDKSILNCGSTECGRLAEQNSALPLPDPNKLEIPDFLRRTAENPIKEAGPDPMLEPTLDSLAEPTFEQNIDVIRKLSAKIAAMTKTRDALKLELYKMLDNL
jgi:hypothetical protein